MQLNTIQRKKARGGLESTFGKEEMVDRMYQIIKTGKQGLDGFIKELGVLLIEAIMDVEREDRSGPQYQPLQAGFYKWAYKKDSLYMGDRKISIKHPRLQGPEGEIPLESYEALKKPGVFSEEFLNKILLGMSARKYRETLMEAAGVFGVSPGTVSCHLVEMTAQRLRGINESAADSLLEDFEDILTLHRLKVPCLLRKTLTCTNSIESMFSTIRDCEGNIKRYCSSAMSQRWLATVLLHCERGSEESKGI